MAIVLEDLKTVTPHPLKEFFKPFILSRIAKMLHVSPGYLGNVLSGHYTPSSALENRMQILANQIRLAEMQENMERKYE